MIPFIFMTFGFAFVRARIVSVLMLWWLMFTNESTYTAAPFVLSGAMQGTEDMVAERQRTVHKREGEKILASEVFSFVLIRICTAV